MSNAKFAPTIKLVLIFIIVSLSFTNTQSLAAQPEPNEPNEPKDLFEMSLEELMEVPVVSSAGFFEMSAKRAPGYSTIIDFNKIENSPERTLEQLLEFYAPGIHTARHERHGALIGTRGVLIDNNAKTLIMLDGQALNQRVHFGYTAPLQLPLMGDWKMIEIINGPGAIVHGSGAINGFINLIPKSGTEFPGLFVNTEVGFVEGLEKVEAGYGIPYGDRKDLYLYGGVVGAEGTTRDEDWGSPSTPTNKDHYVFGHPAPSFKIGSYWHHENFGLNFLLQETNINHGSDISDSVKSDSGWHHGIIALRPKYTLDITDTDSLEFLGSFEFSEHSSFDEPGGQAQGGSEQHEEFKMIGRTTRFDKHSLAGGFLFGNRDFCPSDSYLHSDPESSFESVAFGWREFGVFAEDVIELTDKWTASLGGRWDKVFYRTLLDYHLHPEDSSNVSLRLATAYEFDPETVLKFSYQEGFRYPDARYHAYYFEPMLNAIGLSMPTLEPETMSSYELNFSKKFPEKKVAVDLNAYYNTYKKMLHWHDFQEGDGYFPPGTVNYILYEDPSSPYGPGYYWFGEFTNALGDFDSLGGEVIVNWQPVDKTNLQFIYGYSRPENMDRVTNQGLNLTTDDTDEWIRYPKHQIKTNVTSLFLDDRLVLNVSMLFNDAYSTGDSSLLHPIYGRSRTVVDAMARYALTKQMFIKFGVKNLFESNVPGGTFRSDRPYLGHLGMDKRFYYLELQWRF